MRRLPFRRGWSGRQPAERVRPGWQDGLLAVPGGLSAPSQPHALKWSRMLRTDNGWVHSPSDLVDLLDCDLRSALSLARAAGVPGTPSVDSGGDMLAAVHGQAHEDKV